MKHNNIGRNGLSDLEGLLECPSLEVVDLQQNEIDDETAVDEIFAKMPTLRVLYLMKNPMCKKIRNYRKNVTFKLKDLRYLDDRPVFEDDRRYAEAFGRGGLEEEKLERVKIREERDRKHEEYHKNFKAMMDNARAEKKEADRLKAEQDAAQKSFDEEASGATVEEIKIEEIKVDVDDDPTVYDLRDREVEPEDDLPPELEEVDLE